VVGASGGRFEFIRINTTPTFLYKKAGTASSAPVRHNQSKSARIWR